MNDRTVILHVRRDFRPGFGELIGSEVVAEANRLRAERPENGFTDTTNYVYADQNVPPFNDQFRRIVVTKTIYLRNARSAA